MAKKSSLQQINKHFTHQRFCPNSSTIDKERFKTENKVIEDKGKYYIVT